MKGDNEKLFFRRLSFDENKRCIDEMNLMPYSKDDVINYNVVDCEEPTFNERYKIRYRVMNAEDMPSEDSFLAIFSELWNQNGREKDYFMFVVFFYLPDMDTNLGAYYVFNKEKDKRLSINKNESATWFTKWDMRNCQK